MGCHRLCIAGFLGGASDGAAGLLVADGSVRSWTIRGSHMKRSSLVFSAVLFTFAGTSGSARADTIKDDCEEKRLLSTKKQGLEIRCFHDGRWWSVGTWSKGKEHGKWTYWWSNGNKQKEGEYRNGKKHGNWTHWKTNGTINKQPEYRNGIVVDTPKARTQRAAPQRTPKAQTQKTAAEQLNEALSGLIHPEALQPQRAAPQRASRKCTKADALQLSAMVRAESPGASIPIEDGFTIIVNNIDKRLAHYVLDKTHCTWSQLPSQGWGQGGKGTGIRIRYW